MVIGGLYLFSVIYLFISCVHFLIRLFNFYRLVGILYVVWIFINPLEECILHPGTSGLPQIKIINWDITIKIYQVHEETRSYKGFNRNKRQKLTSEDFRHQNSHILNM